MDNYFNDSLKAKHEKNMNKEYGEESKLTQECLTTGKLSSRSTRIKKSDSEGEVVSTQGESVIFNKERQEFDQLEPC